MKPKNFEDLDCWKDARKLTSSVYTLVKEKNAFSEGAMLSEKTLDACFSVMNFIAEGFGAASRRDFIICLDYAKSACSGIQNCLYIALDQEYIFPEQFFSLSGECEKIRSMIEELIEGLKIKIKDIPESGKDSP